MSLSRLHYGRATIAAPAGVAQLVEHWLPKPRVAGSSPVVRLGLPLAFIQRPLAEVGGPVSLIGGPLALLAATVPLLRGLVASGS